MQALDGREDSLHVTAAAPRPPPGQATLSGFLLPAAGAARGPGHAPGAPARPASALAGARDVSHQPAMGGQPEQAGGPAASRPAVPGPGTLPGQLNPAASAGAARKPCAGRQATLDGRFAPPATGPPAARDAPVAVRCPGGVAPSGSSAPAGRAASTTAAGEGLGQGLGLGQARPGSGPLAARDTNALASGVFAGQGAAADACAAPQQPPKRPQCDSAALFDGATGGSTKRLRAELGVWHQ